MTRPKTFALVWLAILVVAVSTSLIVASSRNGGPDGQGRSGHSCLVDDDAFVTADGGCKDLVTGLVWGTKNMGHGGAGWGWRSAARLTADSNEGGFADWRPPTVSEIQAVRAHGATEHFGGNHVFDANHVYWSSEQTGARRRAVNLESGRVSEHLDETALYFVGVREGTQPDPAD